VNLRGSPLPATPDGRSDAERLLASGSVEVLGLLPRASNDTFLVRVCGADAERLAVYKPRSGETPLWDFPEGTLAQREVAAYLVARSLGWPGVPPTVLRDGPDGLGSVQLFVEMDPRGEHFFTLREDRADDFRRIAAFDAIVNNADRKSGHCLLDERERIFVIDHGVCFHQEPKLRSVIWEFAGEPLPVDVGDDLGRLTRELTRGPLRGELLELLDPEEVRALEDRAAALLAAGVFPHPGPGRSFPWPPV
jgi:uncharacterized repeat protein (TIGR03843 family)